MAKIKYAAGSNRHTCEKCGKFVFTEMGTGLPKGWRQYVPRGGLFYTTRCDKCKR